MNQVVIVLQRNNPDNKDKNLGIGQDQNVVINTPETQVVATSQQKNHEENLSMATKNKQSVQGLKRLHTNEIDPRQVLVQVGLVSDSGGQSLSAGPSIDNNQTHGSSLAKSDAQQNDEDHSGRTTKENICNEPTKLSP